MIGNPVALGFKYPDINKNVAEIKIMRGRDGSFIFCKGNQQLISNSSAVPMRILKRIQHMSGTIISVSSCCVRTGICSSSKSNLKPTTSKKRTTALKLIKRKPTEF